MVEDRRREVSRNPLEWIRDYGLNMDNFIDERQFIEDVANNEDYGTLNGQDGSYDSVTIKDEDYIVMAYEK